MKKILSLALVLVIALHFAGCGQKPSNHGEKSIEAEITNIETGIYWVQIDGEDVKVPITMMHPGKEPLVGDTIRIVYTGEISKEKPAMIEEVLQIYLVEDAAHAEIEGNYYIDEIGKSYQYELKISGTLPNSTAPITFYVYTDDANLSFEEISQVLLSSKERPELHFYISADPIEKAD